MKFCFIAPGFRVLRILEGDSSSSGGAESQIALIAGSFAKIGVIVQVIYGNGNRSPSQPKMIAGVECLEAYPNWRRPSSIFKFYRTLLSSRADFFYANLPDDFLVVVGLARLTQARTRFIYAVASDAHCRPFGVVRPKAWFHNPLYALGLRSADFVTTQHEGQTLMVKPYVSGSIAVVPNLLPITDSGPRPFELTSIDVLWIALIRPVKQLEVFLDLAERLEGLRFAVVGGLDPLTLSSETRSGLEKRLRTMSNLTYFGPLQQTDLLEIINRSRVIVNTSVLEGFPNTMLEAWRAGVPVLSLNVDPGGVITREGLGLVSGGFSRLVEDTSSLATDENLNIAMGNRGFAYVRQQHSLEALCEAMTPIAPGLIQILKNVTS